MSSYAGERSEIPECVELHVLFVPEEEWNSRLNKVSVEAIDSFISAGFIRVYPDMSLRKVRDELGVFFGPERVTDHFCFLKCIGRSLALVKARQEKDLKVKSFAPPYSPYPELYLLPVQEHGSSLCSRSLSPDTLFYNTDSQASFPPRALYAPGQTKEPTKFPLIKHGPHPSVLRGVDDEGSFSSPEEKEEDSVGHEDSPCTEARNMSRGVQEELGTKPCEMSPTTMEKHEKKAGHKINFAGDSGVPGSLESPDTGLLFSQERKSKLSQTLKLAANPPNNKAQVGRPEPIDPVVCDSTPCAPSPPRQIQNPHAALTNREGLLKELKLVKEQRQQLESTRQELLRKGKNLIALNRHRRNQARDKWKRKYFDTKKATAPLEEALKCLRQELEKFYDKLFQQLQARDGRNREKKQAGKQSTKNDLIIQIMTESCEIDNLKKNLDDAKMKLATEIKLRKQAATELQALKAELMQKKSQCSYNGSNLGLGSQLSTHKRA
ncbi:spermatogenesis-associated protein 1 [Hoplias malabaricus]|uniref:spermatogenesis-associated protein 1 n=1 Tax=Hoplias malabaricus TaxID=27720 RepID=UPI003462DBED